MERYEGPERRDVGREIRQAVAESEARFAVIVREGFANLSAEISEHRNSPVPHPNSRAEEKTGMLWDEHNVRKGESQVYRYALVVATGVSTIIGTVVALAALLLTHKGP